MGNYLRWPAALAWACCAALGCSANRVGCGSGCNCGLGCGSDYAGMPYECCGDDCGGARWGGPGCAACGHCGEGRCGGCSDCQCGSACSCGSNVSPGGGCDDGGCDSRDGVWRLKGRNWPLVEKICGCSGCGERYWSDWLSEPPPVCDPCNASGCCTGSCGSGYLQAPYGPNCNCAQNKPPAEHPLETADATTSEDR